MKTICCLLTSFLFVFLPCVSHSQSCTNWLKTPTSPSYVRVGDLDVPGNKITVEAMINRTTTWTGDDAYQGDIVSKHEGPNDVNYLLRPGRAEITTTNGYFKTPAICNIQLNKTYHVAMVYDGSTLKFYRNGFLMSQVAATGNLYQNNWPTEIGYYFAQLYQENFIGYINEVRIWNIARTQSEIQSTMTQSLVNPSSIPGLLAYYTFDDLLNKQGNAAWNGTLGGSAAINQTNPACSLVVDSCDTQGTTLIQAGFTAPDTVCINTQVSVTNTSVGASTYNWNFCTANMNTTPTGINIGNPGNQLTTPCFIDYAYENGNYYGFITSNNPPSLVRFNFGNSLLNTPTATNFGDGGGRLPYGAQGIQLVQESGKWYAIVVGGDINFGASSKILKYDFGTSLTNTPTVTDWGNIGGLAYPHDLFMFKDAGTWYGFTVNYQNGTVTRFNFGSNFNNPPAGTNLGNIGGLNQPSGLCPVNDNGTWRLFVANFGNHTLSRIDFGNTLLNAPTAAVNLGNIGNAFHNPRDLYIFKYCGESVGFLINDNTNDIIRLNFSSLSAAPAVTSVGNVAGFKNPHSISKLFRVGADLFAFVPNPYVNTVSRVTFMGCSNASAPGSSAQNPTPITYNTPGTYNINLTLDEGLVTQTAFCKQVVVRQGPQSTPKRTLSICQGDSIKIGAAYHPGTFQWNNGLSSDSIMVKTSGTYWVETTAFGCSARDSFVVQVNAVPKLALGNDTAICKLDTLFLNAGNTGAAYLWNTSATTQGIPVTDSGYYAVKVTANQCVARDTIHISFLPSPVIDTRTDTTICMGGSVTLGTTSGGPYTYIWTPSTGLSDPTTASPVAAPATTTRYIVTATGTNGCRWKDSVLITVNPAPYYDFGYQQSLCAPKTVQFNTTVSGVPSYQWTFGDGQTAGSNPAPPVTYAAYGNYSVKLQVQYATGCFTTVSKDITVNATYDASMVQNGDTALCSGDSVRINTLANTLNYCWQTSNGQPVPSSLTGYVKPSVSTTYYLNAEQPGANLVANNNFSGGNTGFTSGYSSAATNTTEGQYWVGTTPRSWNPSLSACSDHTTGTGSMMMVNGSPAPAVKIWSQTVAVTPNTNYAFSTWIQSLYSQNPANLKFSINNLTIGDNILAGQPCAWNRFSTTWNSGSNTSAVITIVNNNTIVQGNDFALDDIFFGPVVVRTDSFRVTMAARPALSAGPDTAICEGQPVQLAAAVSGGAITWSPAAGLSNPAVTNPVATPSATTLYIAEARNGQCAVRDTVTVTVKPLPRVSLGRDTSFCIGDSLLLNAGNPGSAYLWQDGSKVQTFTARDTGLYSVQVVTGGCSATSAVHVSYYSLPQFSIMGDTSVCTGASLPIRTVSGGGYSYVWAPATGLNNPTVAEPFATVTGTSRYIATVRNSAGCAVKDTINITAVAPPLVSLGKDTAICAGSTLVLNAGNGGAAYTWNDGSTTSTHSVNGPGTYSVVVSGRGCSAADTIIVSMVPAPRFTLSPLTADVCEGEPQVLSAGGGDRYQWLYNSAPLGDIDSVVRVYPYAGATYRVVITANKCGNTDTLTSVISVKPLPALTLDKSNDVSCATPQARLTAAGAVQYTWSPAVAISGTTVANPTVFPSADTWYKVVARGANGCEAIDSIEVLRLPGPGNTFYIPNAFTPNGDGKNDCFGVRYWGEVEQLQFAIYNRWGERVFFTRSLKDCWNGTFNGVLQPGGVYVYIINVKSICGNADKKGTVTLIR